jgi:hypothetical protein
MYIGAQENSATGDECFINSRYNYPIRFYQNNTHAMTIANGGNVGIGTTSPDSKLQVNGDFHIEGTSNAWTTGMGKGLYFRFHNGNGDGYMQSMDRTNNTYYGLQFDALDYNIRTNGVTKMFIKSDGNVGIGTITNIGEKLVVNGNIETLFAAGKIGFDVGDSYNSGNFAHYGLSKVGGTGLVNLAGFYGLSFGTYGSEKMRLTSNGRLGIGTTNPSENLVVSETVGSTAGTDNFLLVETVVDPFVTSAQGILIQKDDGSKRGFKLFQDGSHDGNTQFKIASFSGSADVDRLTISRGNGNVGIGTTNPSSKLEVNGNIMTTSGAGIIANSGGRGYLAITTANGSLPGYPTDNYPTLKTNNPLLYFSVGGYYSAYMNPGGIISNVSSKSKKENFENLDKQDILQRINNLNLERWNYTCEEDNIKRIGPYAEEFHKEFNLGGKDNAMIATYDVAGVSIVGIQALSELVKSQEKELKKQQIQIEKLMKMIEKKNGK